MWNEIHLVLLANYIFEAGWQEGLKVVLSSPHTHQLFLSMNDFERDKLLRFCQRSAL